MVDECEEVMLSVEEEVRYLMWLTTCVHGDDVHRYAVRGVG
jgi:hypothetical protein